MAQNINLGRIDDSSFKESRAAAIARLTLEEHNRIKTHFMEMDKTPNFDGKLMILDGQFERITVNVQIKSISNIRETDGAFRFRCDTKAMNCVLKNVTFDPVVLIVVDTTAKSVHYKLLTKEFVSKLEIGTQKTKTLCFSEEDLFREDIFIKRIYREVKITNADTDCLVECALIRSMIKNGGSESDEHFQLVYQRGDVCGYFATYRYTSSTASFLLSKIRMEYRGKCETLHFQHDKDFIHINRTGSLLEVTDADIANIVLEAAKEVEKPIIYTVWGKPVYWFDMPLLWQLRSEEIKLPWDFLL